MAKSVAFDVDARQGLKRGIDIVAESVRITLGPKGRNVVLEKKFGAPTVTNDGVTIVREIELKDPWENTGAQLLREVATKTNDVAGDGTTTATLLAQTMINEGFRNVAAGANPMQLKVGIERAVEAVVDEIKRVSVPVKGHEDVAHVAAISSQDEKIGELIAEAMDKGGKDGGITGAAGQGPRLRRSPQGDARGHGHPDRRDRDLRGPWAQAQPDPDRAAGPRPPRDRDQGRHHDRRGRGQARGDPGPDQGHQGPDRGDHVR